jgi:hypothetical protein
VQQSNFWRMGLLSVPLLIFAMASQLGNAQQEFQLPGDHYPWLLTSPLRPYLSSAAGNYLMLKYGDRVPSEPRRIDDIWGLNVRVNDRAQDENPSLTTQSETAIALFGQTIVLGWNDIGQFLKTGSLTGYGVSADGGRTFRDRGVIPPVRGGANLGDPDIAVDSQGNFYFSQISLDADGIAFIGVAKSTDGGLTFSPPISASWNVSGPDSFQDKEFIVADNTGGRFDGNVYVSWTRFTAQGSQIFFARSTDGGRRFEKSIALSSPGHFVQGSIPRVGPGGEVYVAWRDFNAPGIRISKSMDGGVTFGADGVDNTLVSKIEFIGEDAPPGTCESRRILNGYIDAGFEFPGLAVNPLNGAVYVTYNSNPPGIDQTDIYFARSSDGGRSWSEPERVNDDRTTTDQWMPAMTVAPNGTLAIIWYDRRLDPNNLKFDVYMAVSHDGGRTWLPNRRVTTVSSDVPPLGPSFDRVRPCYMADYNDIAADHENFYIVWGDNRERGLTWKTLPDMPTPREATANAAIGSAVFAIGGTKLGFRESGDSDAAEAFNTQSGQWMRLAPMPTPRSGAAATGFGLSIYVLGGQSSKYGGVSGAFERYDALANRWETLPSLPTLRWALGAAQIESRIYAIGGQSCISIFCGETLDAVEVYDLRTGRWSKVAPLPEPRMGFATAVVSGKIYIFGGFQTQQREVFKSVLVYDPVADQWSWAADLPSKRYAASAGVCGEKIIVFDGISASFSPLRRDAWLYDTITGKWEPVAGPKFERVGSTAVTAKNQIFALGGSSSSRVAHSGANEAFDCRNLGYTRPDPDIFFAMEPLSQFATVANSERSRDDLAAPFTRMSGLRVVFRIQQSNPRIESVRVQVYDLRGALIFDSGPTQGPTVQWNLNTTRGALASNGVYLYVLTARARDGSLLRSEVRKITVLR